MTSLSPILAGAVGSPGRQCRGGSKGGTPPRPSRGKVVLNMATRAHLSKNDERRSVAAVFVV